MRENLQEPVGEEQVETFDVTPSTGMTAPATGSTFDLCTELIDLQTTLLARLFKRDDNETNIVPVI